MGIQAVRALVEDDCHRPVVDELDGHARAEHTALHGDTFVGERAAEAVVERLGFLGRCGFREARPVPLPCVLSTSEVNRRMERR